MLTERFAHADWRRLAHGKQSSKPTNQSPRDAKSETKIAEKEGQSKTAGHQTLHGGRTCRELSETILACALQHLAAKSHSSQTSSSERSQSKERVVIDSDDG